MIHLIIFCFHQEVEERILCDSISAFSTNTVLLLQEISLYFKGVEMVDAYMLYVLKVVGCVCV